MEKMKAIISTKYGSPEVLELHEVEKPTPKDDEVLVKIHSTSVTAAHCAMRTGYPLIGRLFMGLFKPSNPISGTDFSGVVEDVGKNVRVFNVGDEVFGATDVDGGTYAEYVTIKESGVILRKPKKMNFNEATAIVEGSMTALPFLRDHGLIKSGTKILIYGASGSIGTAATQIAKNFNANVTSVTSTSNLEWVKSLGADQVIDYVNEDFTKNGEKYDVIFDTVGKLAFKKVKSSLVDDGIYLYPGLNMSVIANMIKSSLFGGKKAIFVATGLLKSLEKKRNIKAIKDFIEEGKLKSVIDRKYDLADVVDAHRYVEHGHKKGNVVLEIA